MSAQFLHPFNWRINAMEASRVTPVDTLLERVARLSNTTVLELRSDRKTRSITHPRFAAMWAARQLTGYSLPQIGRAMGGRDHTTILHGIRRADALRASDPAFRALTDALVAA